MFIQISASPFIFLIKPFDFHYINKDSIPLFQRHPTMSPLQSQGDAEKKVAYPMCVLNIIL